MCARPRRAFTLPEVTAALALFVLCAGILLQSIANARLASATADAAQSRDADRRLIFQKILSAADRTAATRDGKYTAPDGTVYRWSCTLAATDVVDLHTLTVLLAEERDGGEAARTTVTLRALRPAWSIPEEREAALARKRAAAPPHAVS